MKKVLKIVGLVLLCVVVLAALGIGYLTLKEYKPAAVESVSVENVTEKKTLAGNTVSILTMNTGYAGLGDNADFFMDGGKNVRSADKARVRENLQNLQTLIGETNADFNFLQEVDRNSTRTYHIDEQQTYKANLGLAGAFALNYSVPYVPYPMPPIGQVNSGLLTLTAYDLEDAERVSLPSPFKWPVSLGNLKRCLLVARTPLENGRELVLVNLHLEAYDDGEGKLAQTAKLFSVLQEEYEKGNYVIAGGDFNQTFPGSLETYPIKNPDYWTPGVLEPDILPEGWQFAYDTSTPTCRLLNQPYDESDAADTQYYVIDGFILSPNVEALSVRTIDQSFHSTDHNPVYLEAALK